MNQKVIQIGSSAGVTIPKKSLSTLGLEIGSEVAISVDPDKREMIVRSIDHGGIDPETLAWTEQFIDTYKEALEELADK